MQEYLLKVETALLGKRILIRRFREGDGSSFFQLLRKNEGWLGDHFPKTIQANTSEVESEYYIRQSIAAWLLQEAYRFGIWDQERTELIGFFSIKELDWDIPSGEFAYFVRKEDAGKGIMTEAMSLMIPFAIEQLKLEKIRIQTTPDNSASRRLALRFGFRQEGVIQLSFRKLNGALADTVLFGLTKEDYDLLVL